MKTFCYVEPNDGFRSSQDWHDFDRERCVVMGVFSTFYGTLDQNGVWNNAGEPENRWWEEQIIRCRDLWALQGWHDHLGLEIPWFADRRLPPGTQTRASNYLAYTVGMLFKANGDTGRLGMVFTGNEDYSIPSTKIDEAMGDLRRMCDLRLGWNRAAGKGWWDERYARPAIAGAGCYQCYEVVNDDDLANACASVRANGPRGVPWLPCSNLRGDGWPMADEDLSLRYTERVIHYAMLRGVTRFGIHLPQIKNPMGGPDIPRQHRYLDFVDQTILRVERMIGE